MERRQVPRLGRRTPIEPPPDGRTRPPRPMAPSAWQLPPASSADAEGVVGLGGDLAPETLVDAYRRGIFPWPHEAHPLPWFSPDPRGVLDPTSVHVARSLKRSLRRHGWTTTVDVAFPAVVAACADRGAEGTWITRAMARAYGRLHAAGWAHSVEVWDGDVLVGGVYGVQVGAVFTAESMFHRRTDASKVALVDLARRFEQAGGRLLDVQLTTEHLRTLGAIDLPRELFLAVLVTLRDLEVRMSTARCPVDRLVVTSP